MFKIDYDQSLCDNGRLLVLVKNMSTKEQSEFFHDFLSSITVHHEFVFPRSFRGSLSRHQQNLDTQSEMVGRGGPSSVATVGQPVWIRCLPEYSGVNNSWHSLQAHRAVRGLVGAAWCSSAEQVVTALQAYAPFKALTSDTLLSARLFILISTDSDSTLTLQEAKKLIGEEIDKLSTNYQFMPGEVVAHPADQVFTQTTTTANTNNTGQTPPLLNNRLANTVTDLVSEICLALRREVNSLPPTGAGSHTNRSGGGSSSGHRATSSVSLAGAFTSPNDDAVSNSSSSVSGDVKRRAAEEDGDGDSGGERQQRCHSDLAVPDELALPAVGNVSGRSSPGAGSGRKFTSIPFLNFTAVSAAESKAAAAAALQSESGFMIFGHRRSSGRLKKHVGDICLQLGEFDVAQLYYDAALQLLRPITDNLWIAAAIEGQCAVEQLRQTFRSNFSGLLAGSHHRRLSPGGSHLAVGERTHSRNSSITSAMTTAVEDVADPRSSSKIGLQQVDVCALACEALELYRKVQPDESLLEETTLKIARLLIAEKQRIKACELLDSLLAVGLCRDQDDAGLSTTVKRLSTIVELYSRLGYHRRAGFLSWLAFKQNLFPPNAQSLQPLMHGLRVRCWSPTTGNWLNLPVAHSSVGGGVAPSLFPAVLPVQPSAFLNVSWRHQHHQKWDKSSRLFLSGTGSSSTSNVRRTAGVCPLYRWGIRQGDSLSASCLRPLGWGRLQARVVAQLIDRLKELFNLVDVIDLSWERTLILVGYIFSLLDGWPQSVEASVCLDCMDDLCRLAVLRCSDQPRRPLTLGSGSSGGFFSSASGNADPFSRGSVSGLPLRQLVDLIQIPVHQLPSFRVITMMALPSHLLPRPLSKEAAGMATRLPDSINDQVLAAAAEQEQKEVDSSTDTMTSGKVFIYQPDFSVPVGPIPVDWVADEPAEIEFLVDNHLPVPLRISELRIELIPTAGSETQPTGASISNGNINFSPPVSPLSEAFDSGFHSGSNVIPANCIQLQAVRLLLDLSISQSVAGGQPSPAAANSSAASTRTRRGSRPIVTSAEYRLVLNETCLLELAEEKLRHPYRRPEPDWRRRASTFSCSLPARTSSIRMIATVVPTREMLPPGRRFDLTHSPDQALLFRITGITYRLIDCGGIHVCLRSPPVTTSSQSDGHQHHQRRFSNTSSLLSEPSSGVGGIGTVGCESLLPGHVTSEPASSSSDWAAAAVDQRTALTQLVATALFSSPAAVRLHACLPRLLVFPGYIRSAETLQEARKMLPIESIPSLTEVTAVGRTADATTATVTGSSSRGGFAVDHLNYSPPTGGHWSPEVLVVYTLSLYPWETRWLPLQLLVGDTATTIADGRGDRVPSPRHLNVLRGSLEADPETKEFLKYLQLPVDAVVHCHELSEIQRHRLPVNLDCPRVLSGPSSLSNWTPPAVDSEEEESGVQPLCANSCGLVWLQFSSVKLWNTLSCMTTASANNNNNELHRSRKLSFEFELEYAVNVLTSIGGAASRHVCRRARLGLQLRVLSSKHSPLMLYYPRLTFEDDAGSDDDEAKASRQVSASAACLEEQQQLTGDQVKSQTLFYCTLQARLPVGLLPQSILNRDRQYRVEVEVSSQYCQSTSLSSAPAGCQRGIRIATPWNSFSDLTGPGRLSLAGGLLSPSAVAVTAAGDQLIGSVDQSVGDEVENDSSRLESTFHVIRLALDGLADRLFRHRQLQIVSTVAGDRLNGTTNGTDSLRTDEIGLPVPVNRNLLAGLIEALIEIRWHSTLQCRPTQSTILVGNQSTTSSLSLGSTALLLPSARFPRFGRLLLSSHTDSTPSSARNSATFVWPSEAMVATGGPRNLRRPSSFAWCGSALASPSAMAGILWCHNLGLRVSLPEFAGVIPADRMASTTSTYRSPPKSRLCLSCRSQASGRPKRSIFSNPRRRHITVPSLLPSEEKSGETGHLGEVLKRSGGGENYAESVLRRISLVDSPCPKELAGFSTATLNSAARICTYPLYPIAIQINGWVLRHPLKDIHFQSSPYETDNSNHSDYEDVSQAPPASEGLDALPVAVRIYRVWTGPAVYEHVRTESPAASETTRGGATSSEAVVESNAAPKFSLRGPLAEGHDFVFTGKGSGELGLSLEDPASLSQSKTCGTSTTGSVVFFRPGRFWICGLMGLLPESVKPPSLGTSDLWSFSLPSARDVGTLRFSPNGIYIHVLSEGDVSLP